MTNFEHDSVYFKSLISIICSLRSVNRRSPQVKDWNFLPILPRKRSKGNKYKNNSERLETVHPLTVLSITFIRISQFSNSFKKTNTVRSNFVFRNYLDVPFHKSLQRPSGCVLRIGFCNVPSFICIVFHFWYIPMRSREIQFGSALITCLYILKLLALKIWIWHNLDIFIGKFFLFFVLAVP